MRIAQALEVLGKSMSRQAGAQAPLTAEQWVSAAGSFLVVGLVGGMVTRVIGAPVGVCLVVAVIAGGIAGRIAARTTRRG